MKAAALSCAGILFLLSAIPLMAAPTVTTQANLAMGQPVTASSTETTAFSAAKAVDGDPATRWSSKASDPQWISVDLGADYNVTRVVLRWESASAKDYRVELSGDGETWTALVSKKDLVAGARVDDLQKLSGAGRYVRVYCTSRTSKWGCSLFELSVHGTKVTAARTTANFFVGTAGGMPIPLAASAEMLNLGASFAVTMGWEFPAGPGHFGLALETGTIWESTKAGAPVQDPYNSFFIPAAATIGYDLTLGKTFHLFVEGTGGYSATLVFGTASPFGVLKPCAGGGLGLGIDLGPHTRLQAGARFLAVFYDVNTYLGIVPSVSFVFRP